MISSCWQQLSSAAAASSFTSLIITSTNTIKPYTPSAEEHFLLPTVRTLRTSCFEFFAISNCEFSRNSSFYFKLGPKSGCHVSRVCPLLPSTLGCRYYWKLISKLHCSIQACTAMVVMMMKIVPTSEHHKHTHTTRDNQIEIYYQLHHYYQQHQKYVNKISATKTTTASFTRLSLCLCLCLHFAHCVC